MYTEQYISNNNCTKYDTIRWTSSHVNVIYTHIMRIHACVISRDSLLWRV